MWKKHNLYYIVEGEMTLTMKYENREAAYCRKSGDRAFFGKGNEQGCVNTGEVAAQILIIMVKK